MRRKLRKYFRVSTLRQIAYVPAIIRTVQNWFPFLLSYAGLTSAAGTYILRNGIRIRTKDGVESENVAVTFVKKEYGTVENGSVVIDVGAGIGDFALLAALTSKNTCVFAFEPMKENFDTMLENIRLNGAEGVVVPFRQAVAGRTERRTFFTGNNSNAHSLFSQATGSRVGVSIDCISLKDLFDRNKISRCDLMKMDCEGAEYEILYSTPPEYLARIGELRLEYHHIDPDPEHTIERLVEYLRTHDFVGAEGVKFVRNGVLWLRNTRYPGARSNAATLRETA